MSETFRLHWERKLPELQTAARLRIRSRLRDLSRELVRRGLEPLSPGQFRDLGSDMMQESLADHWRRFTVYVESLQGKPYLLAVGYVLNWLEASRLRCPRKLGRSLLGLNSPSRDVAYVPLSVKRLSPMVRKYLELRADGLTRREIVQELFRSEGGRQYQQLDRLALQSEIELEALAVIREAEIACEYLRPSRLQLEALKREIADTWQEPLPRYCDPDEAFDTAQWYARQGS